MTWHVVVPLLAVGAGGVLSIVPPGPPPVDTSPALPNLNFAVR
jgi:hypothetical protein